MSIVEKAVERLRAEEARSSHRSKGTVRADAEPVREVPRTTIDRVAEEAKPEGVVHAKDPLQVDWARVRRAGYLADGEAGEHLRDELRRIKRRLLAKSGGGKGVAREHADRIMVTSASVGEGKTFTAINLAVSLSNERGLDVVLVDADIPKSDLTRLLSLEGRPGLTDALADDSSPPDAFIVPTQIPNLKVLPAGRYHELSAELLNSSRMNHVLRSLEVGDQRRILLFDSSPLLLTADAPVLAAHMEQILLVVAAGTTLQQSVTSAIETLDGAESVSLILNMARLPSGEGYYYGYSGRNKKDR